MDQEESIIEETIDRVRIEETPEDSIVPVYLVPLTLEEEAEREQMVLDQLEYDALETSRTEAKISALSKLEKLGITQEELSALLG